MLGATRNVRDECIPVLEYSVLRMQDTLGS